MPESTLKLGAVQPEKKPYLSFSTAFCLVAGRLRFEFHIQTALADIYRDEYKQIDPGDWSSRVTEKELFDKAMKELKNTKADAGQYASWMDGRYHWGRCCLPNCNRVLIQVESETGGKLRTPTGVWIEQFIFLPGP